MISPPKKRASSNIMLLSIMGQVTFEENYIKKQKRRTENVSRMTSFLIKAGLAKNKKQAIYLKLIIVIILFSYLFWTVPSLTSYKFDGDLKKLPKDVPSYLQTYK